MTKSESDDTLPLAEFYRASVTFPGPTLRLLGLEAARRAVDEQLDHLGSQRSIRLYTRLKREAHTMPSEDVEYEVRQLQGTVNELFPKVFRGGFIISMWSVFEACVKDLAEYVRRERSIPFGLQDLRAGDFLEQTEKFFSGALGIRAFPDREIRTKLNQLKGLRAALVHHDGSTAQLPKSLRAKSQAEYARKGLTVYRDLHHEYAVPTGKFAEASLGVVRTSLERLARDVYTSVHPVRLKDTD